LKSPRIIAGDWIKKKKIRGVTRTVSDDSIIEKVLGRKWFRKENFFEKKR
jgi:hypothetical protein